MGNAGVSLHLFILWHACPAGVNFRELPLLDKPVLRHRNSIKSQHFLKHTEDKLVF